MHAPKHTEDQFKLHPRRSAEPTNPSIWRSSKAMNINISSTELTLAPPNSKSAQAATISLNEFLLRDRERILKSNLELEHFATLAAHDLKSPLQAAFSWLSILSEQLPQKNLTAVDQSIDVIQRNLKNAISYVNELLQISKIKDHKVNLHDCNISQVVSDVIDVHSKSLKEANSFVHKMPLPNVKANTRQLECVFSNLIGNAIKYKHRSRNLTLTIGSITRDRVIEYFVKDNGIGIPSTRLDDIFTLFESGHPRSGNPSTGIGLAFCRKVISLHGGRIWAESAEGQGTIIRFELPKTPLHS